MNRPRRLAILPLLALVSPAFAVPAAAPSALSAFKAKAAALERRTVQVLDRWEAAEGLTQAQALNPRFRPRRVYEAAPGFFWHKKRTLWFRTRLRVPERLFGVGLAGSSVRLSLEVQDRGVLFIDGAERVKFEIGDEMAVAAKVRPGQEIFIVLKIENYKQDKGMLRGARVMYSALEAIDRRTHALRLTAETLASLGPHLGLPAGRLDACLNAAAAALDERPLREGRPGEYLASIERAREALRPLSPALKQFRFILQAYSHIDLVWLWTKDEGENVVWKGTSEAMFKLQAEHPEVVYAASQMHGYRWMERDYPGLFARIRAAVRAGSWEPVGAQWVESDTNLPSGESLVRQFLYGREYSLEKFGRASTVGWLPDTFGWSAQLPQILAKSGLRGLVVWRLHWNDTTPFPYRLFWWAAPDGSRVLVNHLAGRYGDPIWADDMAAQMAQMASLHGARDDLISIGRGDHGSGMPPEYMERALALKADPIFPRIEFGSAEKAFDAYAALDARARLPVWDRELYLQYHRGTYTSQARTKDRNRRNEHLLGNAEKFGAAAAVAAGRPYASAKIEEAWKDLLFNQFHDLLPGSSVAGVYRDEAADSARIAAAGGGELRGALDALAARADTSGPGRAVIVWNGLPWSRDGLAAWPIPSAGAEAPAAGASFEVRDDAGRTVPSQIGEGPEGRASVLFAARAVPPLGYAVYRVMTTPGAAPPGGAAAGVTVAGTTLENALLRVIVDPRSGWVTGLRDTRQGREFLLPDRPAFELQAYQEIFGSDAWDPFFAKDPSGIIPPPSSRFPMPAPRSVRIGERGPVRATVVVERAFNAGTTFRTTYALTAGSPIVEAVIDADWREKFVFLKCAFPLAADADSASYEVPYGVAVRPARPRTPEEKAMWEVPGQRWADLTDRGGRFGVSLLSFNKYGYDARDNVLRLTLLRAPTAPDPQADRGQHRIPLALYPHTGGWEAAETSRRAAEFNDPLIVREAPSHPGAWGKRRGFFAASPAAVHLTAVKPAENGAGWILRLVNYGRAVQSARVDLPAPLRRASETDLAEREIRALGASGASRLAVPIAPWEIKTLRVEF